MRLTQPPPEDHHVHSTFSDDAVNTVAENIAAAARRGLRVLCISDHVRAGTTGLDDYLRTVRAAARAADPVVLCGVEAKILDSSGRLDLPADLPAVDRVLIADHRYPSRAGPLLPDEVRQGLRSGTLEPAEVVDTLVTATARAMRRVPAPQLAHLFSLLPKTGLDESMVSPEQLRLLAETAYATGTVVEVNEKWGCPGPAAVIAFRAAGVAVVPSTDSHRASTVGIYQRVCETWSAAR